MITQQQQERELSFYEATFNFPYRTMTVQTVKLVAGKKLHGTVEVMESCKETTLRLHVGHGRYLTARFRRESSKERTMYFIGYEPEVAHEVSTGSSTGA